MEFRFDSILSRLRGYEIKACRNFNVDMAYKGVRYLDDKTDLNKGILYIGKASVVSDRIDDLKEAGLFIIEDKPLDLSLLQADFALFPSETNLFRLFNDVTDIFDSGRKLIDSSAALLFSLIKGKGLNYIVQVGSEILGNPVFLIDASSKLLAASTDTNVDDIFWNDLASHGYWINEKLTRYYQEGYVDKLAKSSLPIIIDPVSPNSLKRIVGKIHVKGKTIGYIGVLENNRKLKEEDISITKLLCDVIASEMEKDKLYYNLAGVTHEFLLIDLLNEKLRNKEWIKERSKNLFPGVINNLYVASIHLPEYDSNSLNPGYLRWYCENLLPQCRTVYYNDHIILVLNNKDKDEWQDTREKLVNILNKYNASCGLSLMFHDILDTRKHYLQAQKAFILGKLLKRKDVLFDYEDLYIYDLLTSLNDDANADDFCHPGLQKLLQYDKSNGTDYYNTLYEYLLCAGNITRTANKLFLHRNTVVHRINRIQEIIDMDLEDGNIRFKLLLSYKIREMQ